MLPLIKEKWNEILEQMKIENDISEVAFTTWVKYFKPYKIEGNTIVISVEKEGLVINADWFSKKYRMLKYLKPNLMFVSSFQTIKMNRVLFLLIMKKQIL